MELDGTLQRFPQALFKDASPRSGQTNFSPSVTAAFKSKQDDFSSVTSKIIIVGDLGVGKTSMINRFSHNVFEKDYKPTIGVEYELKKFSILDRLVNLQLWDTSGEERFKSITNAYYRGSHAVLVVFDTTEIVTLHHTRSWLDDALHNTRVTVPEVFLVGSKMDLCKSSQLEEIRSEAKAMSKEMNAEYWEVSSKSGKNIKELFLRVAAICFDQAMLKELEKKEKKTEQQKIGGGFQTIELGKANISKAEASTSKKGCCKSS
ncbi:ras-related protein Rab-36-like isoform X2 [Rhopilema esculentum]|uniref:ras-related protein Rab-36-like isoform X2 n=1 Tax=Rhopilema esculentum TaxID=499914 RepID=UPI0031E14C51